MTAVIPDVDTTLDIDFDQLEKDVLDVPCESDPEVHADEFVTATMLWLVHCKDMAFCDDCHKVLIEEVTGATGMLCGCGACRLPFVVSSAAIHPLGPIK